MDNQLYYGDNLEVLRRYIKDESVDLCYIDPPFNSKRNYNQIYNNIGSEDKAQAQAFIDTWEWDDHAIHGIEEIITNYNGKFTHQCIALIIGLRNVLGTGSLLAYLVSMTLKITEIHRILKPTGSFYLHCDPNASHYLKLVLDAVFCSQGGDFRNEIVWCYTAPTNTRDNFPKKHDVIFRYTKSNSCKFNFEEISIPYSDETVARTKRGAGNQGLQDLRKHAIYSVLKVGDRIPMIIAITLKSPDYSFKNKPKRIKQVPSVPA
ncbi:DNA methyltransferase [Planktothrix agardhii]|uniref:DNA methyltransferase n=1 Tax=Planktothrix agardhii TaxID=1160 RepID=UPI001F286F7A|nr:DNA methyltransferase [Planktothrix agardhii]MCF3611716.1 site-specific DNA-methyltransferase [Planktothrix agardhii 1027]